MSGQLQLRRGSTAENDAFTGVEGELTYDTVKKELRVHDGTKQGGFEVPVLVAVQRPTAENNYTWYRKWSDGWVEQGGVFTANIGGTTVSIAYPVEMSDTNYCALLGETDNNTNNTYIQLRFYSKTTTGASIYANLVGSHTNSWQVSGMAAE